jgi:dTDP-4-dehydrorhamnose reductase
VKVLITGKKGQVGNELFKTIPKSVEAHSFDHNELDITSILAISEKMNDIKPDYIINAAAYTNVDKAENESDKAMKTNAIGADYLAQCASKISARLIHISTDFVFDGKSSIPYSPNSPVRPISVYGKSKAEGERLVIEANAANSIILRTSWVYSTTGRNFVKTMINLMQEREQISVVVDQLGSPTWSKNLALTIWSIINNKQSAGIYHYSDAGVASWYDFAIAIYEEARKLELINKEVKILPITTSQYITPATRPSFSVLDSTKTVKIWGVQQEHWRSALRKMLMEQKNIINLTNELIRK